MDIPQRVLLNSLEWVLHYYKKLDILGEEFMPKYLTLKELCTYLGYTKGTVHNYVSRGIIPEHCVVKKRIKRNKDISYLFIKDEIDKLVFPEEDKGKHLKGLNQLNKLSDSITEAFNTISEEDIEI